MVTGPIATRVPRPRRARITAFWRKSSDRSRSRVNVRSDTVNRAVSTSRPRGGNVEWSVDAPGATPHRRRRPLGRSRPSRRRRAPAADKVRCTAAYEQGQELRRQDKLSAARSQLLICEQTCPKTLAADCTRWQGEVEALMPTVRLRASDGQGHPVPSARAARRHAPGRGDRRRPGARGLRATTPSGSSDRLGADGGGPRVAARRRARTRRSRACWRPPAHGARAAGRRGEAFRRSHRVLRAGRRWALLGLGARRRALVQGAPRRGAPAVDLRARLRAGATSTRSRRCTTSRGSSAGVGVAALAVGLVALASVGAARHRPPTAASFVAPTIGGAFVGWTLALTPRSSHRHSRLHAADAGRVLIVRRRAVRCGGAAASGRAASAVRVACGAAGLSARRDRGRRAGTCGDGSTADGDRARSTRRGEPARRWRPGRCDAAGPGDGPPIAPPRTRAPRGSRAPPCPATIASDRDWPAAARGRGRRWAGGVCGRAAPRSSASGGCSSRVLVVPSSARARRAGARDDARRRRRALDARDLLGARAQHVARHVRSTHTPTCLAVVDWLSASSASAICLGRREALVRLAREAAQHDRVELRRQRRASACSAAPRHPRAPARRSRRRCSRGRAAAPSSSSQSTTDAA